MSYLGNLLDALRGKAARPAPIIQGKKSITWNGDRGWRPMGSVWAAGDEAPKLNDEAALLKVYSKLDIVNACINAKADAFVNAPIMVSSGMGDSVTDYPNHPALDLFYKNPCYTYGELWRLIIARLDLTGASFNLLGLYNEIAGAGKFTPLPTQRVTRQMAGANVLGYEFERGSSEPLKLKPEEICAILFPDPENFGGYVSPLQAAARAGNTDQQRQDTTYEVLKNKTIPGGFLEFEKGQPASKAQMEQLKDSYERATGAEVANRGRVAALPPGVKFAPGVDTKDIDFTALNSLSETRISAVLRVPAIVVGLYCGLERATFANFAEANKTLYSNGVKPLWTYIAEALSHSAILGDSGLYFRFDYSQVKELQEDRTAQVARAVSLWNSGLVTKNQALAEAGLPQVTDGTGEETKAPPPSPFGPGGDEEDKDTEDKPPFGKCACGGFHGKADPAIGYFKNSRPLTEALRRFFNEQSKAVEAAVLNGRLDGFKAFCREWDKRLEDMTRPPLRQLWEAEVRGKLYKVNAAFVASPAGKSMRMQGKAMPVITGAFDVIRKEAMELLNAQLHDYAKSVNETTGARLDAAIAETVKTMQENNTIPALKSAVQGVFKDANDSRARMIAITESSRATHDGAILAASRSGVVKSFEFLASGDACPDCLPLNGKTVTLEEAESELGEYDRQLPPVHPNCQCTLLENLVSAEELEEMVNAIA